MSYLSSAALLFFVAISQASAQAATPAPAQIPTCTTNADCAAGCYCGGDQTCQEAGFCTTDQECGPGFKCEPNRGVFLPRQQVLKKSDPGSPTFARSTSSKQSSLQTSAGSKLAHPNSSITPTSILQSRNNSNTTSSIQSYCSSTPL